VVRVEEGAIIHAEHRAADEVRWVHAQVDVSGARDPIEALAAIQNELRPAVLGADGRPLAARVSITADGLLAQRLKADPAWFEAEVRGHAAAVSDALWIERVKISAKETMLPAGLPQELQELLAQALDDPDCLRAIESAVAPLTAKLPADIDDPDIAPLLSSARARDGQALVRAARALVEARLNEGAE
jgi:hypothetical protein